MLQVALTRRRERAMDVGASHASDWPLGKEVWQLAARSGEGITCSQKWPLGLLTSGMRHEPVSARTSLDFKRQGPRGGPHRWGGLIRQG